jgi:hypothetical protein
MTESVRTKDEETMKILMTMLSAVVLGAMAIPAGAHHSAAQFDFDNTVLLTGEVVEARFANPHMHLVLEVTDEERGTRDIEFEGHSRNNMVRQGLLPGMFEVGDTVTIRIAPMRNGSDGGYVLAVRTPEGEEIGRITSAD